MDIKGKISAAHLQDKISALRMYLKTQAELSFVACR